MNISSARPLRSPRFGGESRLKKLTAETQRDVEDAQRTKIKRPSLLRGFCAIELPPEVRAACARYIETLREAGRDVRASWDKEEKLHLTLKFFGEIEEGRIQTLTDALARAASLTTSFELKIRGTGAFPPRGLPRVLWLGVVDESGKLAELHQHLEDECAARSFPREHKSFHPHLTIARLRRPEGARRLANLHKSRNFDAPAFDVNEIVLMKSDLSPHGSSYTKLATAGIKSKDECGSNEG